jgi:(R,R)-butanediol dehydrogenase/meso-butanediol dehydrogenase/diacetyl reductase
MRALVNRGPGNFVVEERPDPRAGPGDLLVRPLYTGVCVSDKHVYEGRRFGPAWAEGLVLGHEFDATVMAVGSDVEGWKGGERVSVDPRLYCRECPNCRGGLPTLCERGAQWLGVADGRDGGFADLCVAPAYGCHRLDDDIDDARGALAEPLAAATRCLRRSGLAVDDNVVLLGADDYGLLLLQRLRHAGAGEVAVIDPSAVRRAAAAELGASVVLDPGAGSVTRAVRELMPRGADVAFVVMEDYVPASAQYLNLAFRACRVQGTVAILRTYGSAPYAAIDPQIPYLKEITIRHAGAFFGEEPVRGGRPRGDWQTALGALATGDVTTLPTTRVVDFDNIDGPASVAELFTAMPDEVTKTLVRIGGSGCP